MKALLSISFALCAVVATGTALTPDEGDSLSVFPTSFRLDSAVDQQRIVVVRTDRGGLTHDESARVEVLVEPAGAVEVLRENGLVLVPKSEGEVSVTLKLGDHQLKVPGQVRNAVDVPATSFRNEVLPAMTRAGCNSGACHGAAAGKNGFGLTLFGYDPGKDHRVLTRDLFGRRIDVADPERSLLLTKPLGEVRHKGGVKIEKDDPVHTVLRDWISQGARDDVAEAAQLVGIEVGPREFVLEAPSGDVLGGEGQLVVTARYSDGSTRDVTRFAILSSSSSTTVSVGDEGQLQAGQRGEAYVLARYGTFAEVAQVLVLPAGVAPPALEVAARNEVDRFIFDKMLKLRHAPVELCDDSTFVRRVTLDLAGRLPTKTEVETFLAEAEEDSAAARARVIDTLLESEDFASTFASMWESVLKIEEDRLERKGAHLWTRWLRESIRDRVPFDEIVREMLTANGSGFDVPPANYYLTATDPKIVGENVAQTFLGIRVQCAQCHNHPFERWRMDDYYGFAAFFAQVGRKGGSHPRETIIYNRGGGDIRNARTKQIAKPVFLGGDQAELKSGTDRRVAVADWLTSKENPWFAKNVANRVWARLFGRGLVDPVDDVRVSNPPSHPALHNWLGDQLANSDFDVRDLVRTICLSHTYQAAQLPEGIANSTYAGREPRRMSAEQLLDAIDDVTGVPTKLRGLALGASSADVVGGNPRNRFLDLFGRPRRESVCACERRTEPTLNQVLHLINGSTIEDKLRSSGSFAARAMAEGADPKAMLEELFLRAYARQPKTSESEHLLARLAEAEHPRTFWEDLGWAVLNSREFVFQH